MVVGSNSRAVPVKIRLKSWNVRPSISWVVLILKVLFAWLLFVAHVCVTLIVISHKMKATCSSCRGSGGVVWCEGPLLQIIICSSSLDMAGALWGGRVTLANSSSSLPPCSFTQSITHTHRSTQTFWHLWLQWLPSVEMKSYFCFQITDCQSSKWICSHQRCEIDILFSNFNLFSCDGCCLVGLPLTPLYQVFFFFPASRYC